MGEFLEYAKEFPEKMISADETLQEIVDAGGRIAMELHMATDSMDVIVDASDTISNHTDLLKDKAMELKELASLPPEEAQDALREILSIAEEVSQLADAIEMCAGEHASMSHDIQKVVNNLADSLDQTHATAEETLETFEALTEEAAEIVEGMEG